MKKIFTLIATALMTVGANAQDAKFQIYTEVEPNTYAVTTNLDAVKAEFGEETVTEAWGMGVWLPVDYVLIDNANLKATTAVDLTPIYFSGNKFTDMQKEFPAYTGYMNLGSSLGQNNWKGTEVIEDLTALKAAYHGAVSVFPKVDGTLSFGVYAGDNSRSIGIFNMATEDEMNEEIFMGAWANYYNFRHDGVEAAPDGTIPAKGSAAYVSAEVKAGRQYILVGGANKNLTMHQIKFVPAQGTGINNAGVSSEKTIEAVYTLGGIRTNGIGKGVNIVKYSDGTTVKIVK